MRRGDDDFFAIFRRRTGSHFAADTDRCYIAHCHCNTTACCDRCAADFIQCAHTAIGFYQKGLAAPFDKARANRYIGLAQGIGQFG